MSPCLPSRRTPRYGDLFAGVNSAPIAGPGRFSMLRRKDVGRGGIEWRKNSIAASANTAVEFRIEGLELRLLLSIVSTEASDLVSRAESHALTAAEVQSLGLADVQWQ